MSTGYLWVKFLHILVAVISLGTSAGLGIVLEFYGNDPTHGSFVLRTIERMVVLVVLPGFLLMLTTGLWLTSLAWPFTTRWIQLALGLWVVGIAGLSWSLVALRKQRHLHTTEAYTSIRYAQASIASRVSGGAFGIVVVATLYLMVLKP
jgi:uncharacterized membrane protein